MYPWFQARCRSDKPTITLQRYDIISDFANVAWQKFDFGNQLTEIPLIVCKKTWVGYDYCLLPQEAFSAVLVLKYKTTRTTMKVIRVEYLVYVRCKTFSELLELEDEDEIHQSTCSALKWSSSTSKFQAILVNGQLNSELLLSTWIHWICH